MYNCNRVALIGNVGHDPQLRATEDATPYLRLAVATHERWKDDKGALQTRREWHTVVVWGKLAETAHEALKKGSYVSVEGTLRSREYKDKAGITRHAWEIRATHLGFLDRRQRPDQPELDGVVRTPIPDVDPPTDNYQQELPR